MTEEIETLKDLQIIDLNIKDKSYEYEQGKGFAKSWIKQEAIKLIKKLRDIEDKCYRNHWNCIQLNDKYPQFSSFLEEHEESNCLICNTNLLEHFLNITEEDLK